MDITTTVMVAAVALAAIPILFAVVAACVAWREGASLTEVLFLDTRGRMGRQRSRRYTRR